VIENFSFVEKKAKNDRQAKNLLQSFRVTKTALRYNAEVQNVESQNAKNIEKGLK
jgi:hypothetical protein